MAKIALRLSASNDLISAFRSTKENALRIAARSISASEAVDRSPPRWFFRRARAGQPSSSS
jgi:hypothetical protein